MADEKLALFDLEGTLMDHDSSMMTELANLASPDEPKLELVRPGRSNDELPPHIDYRVSKIHTAPNWWRNLTRIKATLRIVLLARKIGFRPQIIGTNNYSEITWKEKTNWIRANVGLDLDIILPGYDPPLYGRVLCCDIPSDMDEWLRNRPNVLGFMPLNKYNLTYDHPQVIRYSPIKDYIEASQYKMFTEQAGEGEDYEPDTEIRERLMEIFKQ